MKGSVPSLDAGAHIAGRFTVLALAGRGGMGMVYRALDAHTGQEVAVKVLRADVSANIERRFLHEAQILSGLRHPGIVQYIAHGRMAEGLPYLAMAWLQGEDLSLRLSRARLDAAESLTLLLTATDALAVAHRRGIVHRDLKPANLFLREGEVAQVTLLDFGIARQPRHADHSTLTQAGTVMGTPEYMAPEQARGEQGVGPSADVFSLGAILFECLTGQPPFAAEHFAAVLAKIMFVEPPPLRRLCPELPAALEVLLQQMLHKNPARRPQDADALVAALRAIGSLPDSLPPVRTPPRTLQKITHEEQHFVCALAAAVPSGSVDLDATLYPEVLSFEVAARRSRIEQSLSALKTRTEWLVDGTLICSFAHLAHTADQARQAGRAALLVAHAWPQSLVAVATGQGQRSETSGLPIGAALDHVVGLLRRDSSVQALPGRVLLDELTVRFLDARFRTEGQGDGLFRLLGFTEEESEAPKLLGRPTPFVGRDQELGALWSTYRTCRENAVARVVLVTAPPGAGKSRLLHELRRQLASEDTALHRLTAQADPAGLTASGGLIGQAIARICGWTEAEDADTRRGKLRQFIAAHLSAQEAAHATAFLGELCGVPFSQEEQPLFAAAQLNPQNRDEQLSQAVLSLLRALCRQRPTVILLEDLHWGDDQTVRCLDVALRELADQPLLVVAFARPEVREVFPKLWPERSMQELRLLPLGKRASERLIDSVLGEQLDSQVRARLIAQSNGNALFLEELIRAHAEGQGDEAPATVLAMLQSRLLRLPAEVRRVLRAASVFGPACFRDGIIALLAGSEAVVDAGLKALVDAEILEHRASSRLAGQTEYGFRHALMQQAAYVLLLEGDRVHGHFQAALFLVRIGSKDAAELASHFERGAAPAQALPYYVQAGQHAFELLDLPAIHRYSERAIACAEKEPSAPAVSLGIAWALRCMGFRYQGNFAAAVQAAETALPLLEEGSAWWLTLFHNLAFVLQVRGERARALSMMERWNTIAPRAGAEVAYLYAGCFFLILCAQAAERRGAERTRQRLEQCFAEHADCPEFIVGMIVWARSQYLRAFAPDPFRQWSEAAAAVEHFTKKGAVEVLGGRLEAAQAQTELGDIAAGVRELRACCKDARNAKLPTMALIPKAHLMAALAMRVETSAEAAALALEILHSPAAGDGFRGWARTILAKECLWRDAVSDAAAHLEHAISLSAANPLRRLYATSLKVHLLLRREQVQAARALAEESLLEATERGGGGYCATAVGLAAICARFADGETASAHLLLRATVAEIERRASLILDETARTRYLRELPENAVALSGAPWAARFPF